MLPATSATVPHGGADTGASTTGGGAAGLGALRFFAFFLRFAAASIAEVVTAADAWIAGAIHDVSAPSWARGRPNGDRCQAACTTASA